MCHPLSSTQPVCTRVLSNTCAEPGTVSPERRLFGWIEVYVQLNMGLISGGATGPAVAPQNIRYREDRAAESDMDTVRACEEFKFAFTACGVCKIR